MTIELARRQQVATEMILRDLRDEWGMSQTVDFEHLHRMFGELLRATCVLSAAVDAIIKEDAHG